MTSRIPAEPTPEHDRRRSELEQAAAAGTTDHDADRADAPAAPPAGPKPGDLGEQAPDVEPARPNWSRLAAADAPAGGDAAPPEDVTATTRRRVPLWLVLVLALVGIAADQGSKFWAMAALDPGSYRPLIGELLGFQLVFNSGAAFSLAEGMTWVFTIVAAVVAVVIVRVARNLRSRAWALVLAGLLGGTLGNLFDRLFREPGFGRGYVVDFINYNGYFVGNVADIFIVAAAIGMGVLTFIGIGFDGRRAGRPIEDDASAPGDEPAADTPPADDASAPGDEPAADTPPADEEPVKASGEAPDGSGARAGSKQRPDGSDDATETIADEESIAAPESPTEPRG